MEAKGISTYGRAAQGVRIMNLDEGVKVIAFARTDHVEEEEEAAEEVSAQVQDAPAEPTEEA